MPTEPKALWECLLRLVEGVYQFIQGLPEEVRVGLGERLLQAALQLPAEATSALSREPPRLDLAARERVRRALSALHAEIAESERAGFPLNDSAREALQEVEARLQRLGASYTNGSP